MTSISKRSGRGTPEFKLNRFTELMTKDQENALLTPMLSSLEAGNSSAGPVSGTNVDDLKVMLKKNPSMPTLSVSRKISYGMLPAIPEVNGPRSLRQYQSESKYRKDLLLFASYNAAGLLRDRSLP